MKTAKYKNLTTGKFELVQRCNFYYPDGTSAYFVNGSFSPMPEKEFYTKYQKRK